MKPFNRSLWLLFAALAGTLLMVLLVRAGVWDPRPVGTLFADHSLGQISGVQWVEPVDGAFSVQIETVSAETTALLLKNDAETLHIAINPVGFFSIWTDTDGSVQPHYPWQTWPHIEPNVNEIWLDVRADGWSLRFNKELFYEGDGWLDSVREVGVDGGDSAEINYFRLYK